MRAVLGPLVEELGAVSEELGREREREELRRELQSLREAREFPESPSSPDDTSAPAPGEAQMDSRAPERRSWWRRVFGG